MGKFRNNKTKEFLTFLFLLTGNKYIDSKILKKLLHEEPPLSYPKT